MADISKDQIKLMSSEVLADTEDGGGQMTANEIVDGSVNNLFPDISRLDRTYGRVSLRKAFVSVQTDDRATYYGAHVALTEQAADPLVTTTLFTTENWFDTRDNCKDRLESYLAKGPQYGGALLGKHYLGTKSLMFFGYTGLAIPEIGDVLVLVDDENEQYVRVVDASSEEQGFVTGDGTIYNKDVVTIEIGSAIENDYAGDSPSLSSIDYNNLNTTIYTTVVADASKYYGITNLSDEAQEGELKIKVDSIYSNIVPASKSQTAVTDFGVGMTRPAMVQTANGTYEVAGSLTLEGTTVLGYGISPGALIFEGSVTISDDGAGNITASASNTIIGSVDYETGSITLDGSIGSGTTSGTFKFTPSVAYDLPTCTGAIYVDINNRGYVFVYNCIPAPKEGTLRVDYLAEGKWYSLYEDGVGHLSGTDSSIGTGTVNFTTGSVSLTLGAQPDTDSSILLYWGTEVQTTELPSYEGNGEIKSKISFETTNTPGPGTLEITWNKDDTEFKAICDSEGILNFEVDGENVENGIGRYDYATKTGYMTPPVTLNAGEDTLTLTYNDGNEESVSNTLVHDGSTEFSSVVPITDDIIPGSVVVSLTLQIDEYSYSTAESGS